MNKTWKPIAAGIMGVIVGGLQVPFAFLIFIGSGFRGPLGVKEYIIFVMMALFAFFAIVGGINHLRRTKWPLAMAGSIAVFFSFAWFMLRDVISWFLQTTSEIYWIELVLLLPGIVAIVLTALSKKEFGESAGSAKSAKARDNAAKRISEETRRACKKIKSIPKKYRY